MKPSNTPKTRQQIATEIGVSYSTFWRWLKKNNVALPKGLVYRSGQELIYKLLTDEKNPLKEDETT